MLVNPPKRAKTTHHFVVDVDQNVLAFTADAAKILFHTKKLIGLLMLNIAL